MESFRRTSSQSGYGSTYSIRITAWRWGWFWFMNVLGPLHQVEQNICVGKHVKWLNLTLEQKKKMKQNKLCFQNSMQLPHILCRGSSFFSACVLSPPRPPPRTGSLDTWYVRWNNCKPLGMPREGVDMWHLTNHNYPREPGMPHIYRCGISGESQLPQQV